MARFYVRAAIVCADYDMAGIAVGGLRGITPLREALGTDPPFRFEGVLFVSLVAAEDVPDFALGITPVTDDGATMQRADITHPGIRAGGQVERAMRFAMDLPTLGRYWFVVSVDGVEVTRVPFAVLPEQEARAGGGIIH